MAIRGRKHLKRIAAPKAWPILKKIKTFVVKTTPGPHSMKNAISVFTLLKEMLKIAKTTTEAKKIINNKELLINQKLLKQGKVPVGFMDVVSIPKLKKHYRMLLNQYGKLQLYEIPEKNADFVLSKIKNKTIVKKGIVQLNLEDGRNLLVEKDTYKTGDTLKIKVPEQKIIDHFKLEKGNVAYVISGKHAGEIGTIKEVTKGTGKIPASATLESKTGTFKTVRRYVFVIGKDKPVIKIG